MTQRRRGQVLKWMPHKEHPYCFGFIRPDDALREGEGEVYFKSDSIAPMDPAPFPDAIVEFDLEYITRGDGRTDVNARNVRVISDTQSPSQDLRRPERLHGIVKFFNDKAAFGFVETDKGDVHVGMAGRSVSHSGAPLRGGDLVEVTAIDNDRGKTAQEVRRVGFEAGSKYGDPFNDFFEFGSRQWKQKISKLAENEPWEFRNSESHTDLPVLSSYIMHTVRRLLETDNGFLYSQDGNALAFNTGLVTEHQEQIFGFASKLNDQALRPWRLDQFLREGQRSYSEVFGGKKPPLASYWDDPAELIFDPRLSLEIDTNHIMERLDRFPDQLRSNEHMARNAVIAAKTGAELRAYRNYKVAVPQYFRFKGGEGELQLLLPICLENPSRADLAITVAKTASKEAYRSATVLTLDQAYSNARLLARPDRDWLDPEFE